MPAFFKTLSPRMNRIAKMVYVALSMFVFSFAITMQRISAVGLAPWNALNDGVSKVTGITFGQASIYIGIAVLIADLLLKEKIGFGTVEDAVLVGAFCDVIERMDIIPYFDSYLYRFPLFIGGLAVSSFGMYMYMSAGLSCGPRDAFGVAIGKRLRQFSPGTAVNIVHAVVIVIVIILGGDLGIGTVASIFLHGKIMDFVFSLVSFDPRDVENESIIATAKVLITNKE